MAGRRLFSLLVAACMCHAQSTQPRRDPFYNIIPSASLQAYDYGYILDYRSNINNLQTVFYPTTPAIQNAWQIKFVTSDAQGNKVAAITTLLQPYSAKNGFLVSYQPAYDSANIDCSPSYQLGAHQYNINNLTEPLGFEQFVMGLALDQGYWVNVPDYEGLTASFTSGLTSGYGTLDSLRAVLNSNAKFQSGLSSTPYIGLIGYSGGSIATEWASELQPSHSPSLNSLIAAIVIGGLPVDISKTVNKVNGPSGSDSGNNVVLIPNALQGLASAYPAFASYLYGLSRQTSFATQQSFNYSMDSCNDASHYAKLDIFQTYLNTNAATFLSSPQLQTVLNAAGIMGKHGSPTHPTYIFQGAQDEVVDAQRVTDLVNQYCGSSFSTVPGSVTRNNVSIQYVLDIANGGSATHAGESLAGINPAFQFLQNQFANPSPTALTGCTFMTAQPSATSSSSNAPSPGPGFHN